MFCQEYTHKHTHIYVDTRTYTQTDRQKSAQTSPPFPGTQTHYQNKDGSPRPRNRTRPSPAEPCVQSEQAPLDPTRNLMTDNDRGQGESSGHPAQVWSTCSTPPIVILKEKGKREGVRPSEKKKRGGYGRCTRRQQLPYTLKSFYWSY